MDVSRKLLVGVVAGIGIGWGLSSMGRPHVATPEAPKPAGPSAEETRVAVGRELFHREWTPGEPSVRGGDGIGPVYNDTSCVACHNLGESGGGGPVNKNVDIVSSSASPRSSRAAKAAPDVPRPVDPKEPAGLFVNAPSVVLHRFGVEPDYAPWRVELLGAASAARPGRGGAAPEAPLDMARAELASARLGASSTSTGREIQRSQRNPSSLLGDGRIDAITEPTIVAAADRRFPEFPGVTGRVSRLKGGALGRFGWKGQVASLGEFVRTACSVELGLEVPGHAQAGDPLDPARRPSGLDLDDTDCDALAAYVRGLAPPASVASESATVRAGRSTFASVGCATCHMPDLGAARGIYSDLSLHDMGPEMSDSGSYYGLTTGPSPASSLTPEGATANEWRTPPLWGVRDSAPYLHDGRAETLDQAIAFHGGEAKGITDRYFGLPPGKRRQVIAFLNTLGEPVDPEATGAGR